MKYLGLNRRHFLGGAACAVVAGSLPGRAFAQLASDTALHGISAFGNLKYPKDFGYFDYVNPDAPRGGVFRFAPSSWLWNQNTNTFNTLNSFSFKGDSPPRLELTFDALMAAAFDEPDSLYGLIAESVTISPDRQTFLFKLRKAARFHDGSPVQASDIVFTYRIFQEKGHPHIRQSLSALELIEEDEGDVRMRFSEGQPKAVFDAVTLPILSENYFDDKNFESTATEPILGSGAYRVGNFVLGQFIEYDRVDDYWAKDLPINRGQNNFDRIRIEFYRDRQPEFEAFKKGAIDFRAEYVAKNWATGYEFPAIKQNKVIKRTFAREKRPLMQAWALNQRREHFRDPRVREAIGLCFDFEWTNKNLFYGAYERSQSCFNGSDFQAVDLPTAQEHKILERYKDRLPPEIYGPAPIMAVSDGSGRDRKQFSRAIQLLKESGFIREKGNFHDETGQKLSLEILSNSESFSRIYNPFVQRLRAIGIDASLRLVDASQYQSRVEDFDFDMVGMAMQFGATPTKDSLAGMFGSKAANMPGSYNLPGTSDPIIDALIEDVGTVTTRDELVATIRVLDRYLRIRREWIPNWTVANHRVAYWDRFGFKEPKPDYGFPVETLWWLDKEKAETIGRP